MGKMRQGEPHLWLTFSTHSYSPNLESKVPFCSERSLSVKRGPSSWIPTFFSFLKMYLNRRLRRAHSATQLFKDAFLNYILWVNMCFYMSSQSTSSPVEPEKNEVSLVVEGDHLSAQKLWVLGEEGGKESSDAVAQTSGEVVQNHFGIMFCWIFAPPLRKRKHSVTLLHLGVQISSLWLRQKKKVTQTEQAES